jgi:hypothetical protein
MVALDVIQPVWPIVFAAAVLGALFFLRVIAKARQDQLEHYRAMVEAKRMRMSYEAYVAERVKRTSETHADYEVVG